MAPLFKNPSNVNSHANEEEEKRLFASLSTLLQIQSRRKVDNQKKLESQMTLPTAANKESSHSPEYRLVLKEDTFYIH